MAAIEKIEQLEPSVWPKHIIKLYIDIMVEEVAKGNMKNGLFPPKVWRNMLQKLNSKSQRTFSLVQFKQKFNRLRTKHKEFSQLLQHTGFGWDAETNTVTANEEIWNNYIVAHPKASKFKKHGLEHYKMLDIIFNKSIPTGVFYHASTEDPPNYDHEVRLDDENFNYGVCANLDKDEDNVALDIVEHITHRGKRSIEFSDRKKNKEHKFIQIGEAIQSFAQASNNYSISACVAILNGMNLSNNIYVKAMNQFTDPIKRELFMVVPLERKKAWLEKL